MNLKEFLIKCKTEYDVNLMAYSGRGMFGRQCPAVSGDSVSCIVSRLIDIASCEIDNSSMLVQLIKEISTYYSKDSLGLGVVIYYQTITWDEEFEND